jgi:hypothetical protein
MGSEVREPSDPIGLRLVLWRAVLRCSPLSAGGLCPYQVDPIKVFLNLIQGHSKLEGSADRLGPIEERNGVFEQKFRNLVRHDRPALTHSTAF